MLNKKGQIGDTLTWMIATIIIVVVLIFFIFGASMFGKTKSLGNFKTSIFSNDVYAGNDFFIQKTIFTYLLSDEETSRKKMFKEITSSPMEEGFISGNESLTEIRRNYDLK